MKIPHSKISQVEYLFPGERTYLLVKKCWRNSYFPVNNYLGVLFFVKFQRFVFSEKRFFVLGVYLFSLLAIQNVFKTVTCTAFQSFFGISLKLKVKECFLMMWRTSLSETTLISYTSIIKKQIQNLLLWIVFVQFLCNSRYYCTVWL